MLLHALCFVSVISFYFCFSALLGAHIFFVYVLFSLALLPLSFVPVNLVYIFFTNYIYFFWVNAFVVLILALPMINNAADYTLFLLLVEVSFLF